jgi:hypothetical protein
VKGSGFARALFMNKLGPGGSGQGADTYRPRTGPVSTPGLTRHDPYGYLDRYILNLPFKVLNIIINAY